MGLLSLGLILITNMVIPIIPIGVNMYISKKTTKKRGCNSRWLVNPKRINLVTSVKLNIFLNLIQIEISSVAQSCPSLCDPINGSTPGLPVHHQLPEFTQTHVHWVGDAIQPSHPLSSPSPPALSLSQHQGLFQWVSSSHQVAKILEFQLQHQSHQ